MHCYLDKSKIILFFNNKKKKTNNAGSNLVDSTVFFNYSYYLFDDSFSKSFSYVNRSILSLFQES